MKALVTGASGFIGSTLIAQLNREKIAVRALMRASSSDANLKGLAFERVQGHLGDLESLRAAVEGVDYVFHLAGVVAAANEAAFHEANAAGTAALAQAVAEVAPPLKRFVYVSSLAAAGPASQNRELQEDDVNRPVSAYGRSKLAGETALLAYKDQYPISIVRPPLVYGPRDKAVFLFFQAAVRRLVPLISPGSGEHKYYSAVHAADLCQGILKAAQVDPSVCASGEVFYIAGDGVHSYRDLMDTIGRHVGRRPIYMPVPAMAVRFAGMMGSMLGQMSGKTLPLNRDKVNELLPDFWLCSNQKAKDILGYRPDYDLDRGLNETARWYQEQGWL